MRFNRFCLIFLSAAVGCLAASHLSAQTTSASSSTLVRVKLAHGIELGIPVGWVLQDAASNRRRTERGTAVLDLAGVPTGQASALLTASPDGDPDRTSVVISLIRRPSASQADVASLSDTQIRQISEQFREDLEAGMRVEGATMIEWAGAGRVRLGDLYSLVSHYTYRMPNGDARTMESHRVFLGGGSVGFMLQAPVQEAESRRADLDAIRASFRASALP